MGEKLPVISGKELLNFYLNNGCELKRVKGSHHVVMSMETYEKQLALMEVYKKLAEAEAQIANGVPLIDSPIL